MLLAHFIRRRNYKSKGTWDDTLADMAEKRPSRRLISSYMTSATKRQKEVYKLIEQAHALSPSQLRAMAQEELNELSTRTGPPA